MLKRTLSGVLWFTVTAWGCNYAALLLGTSSDAFLVIAGAVGLFVVADPVHLLWQTRPPAPAIHTVQAGTAPAATHGTR